ncbi:hypothetical protein [Flavobacterium rhamnosiphilum]|nr:hypothetical protein [Flavobacterium rhamnosiphilum]
MIKAIIGFFKNLWEKEIDYEFEIEFSIYDVIAGVGLLVLLLWCFLK